MFKKNYNLFLIVLLSSCQANIQQIISERYVTISLPSKEKAIKDSLYGINIPIELKINKSHKVKMLNVSYIKNDELTVGNDYLIYDGETNNPIFPDKLWEEVFFPESIYFVDRTNFVDKEIAKILLKKYNSNTFLENIKTYQDTIKLVPYSQFRKDFPAFIEEMRKEPDSLQISIRFKSGKKVFVSEKINW